MRLPGILEGWIVKDLVDREKQIELNWPRVEMVLSLLIFLLPLFSYDLQKSFNFLVFASINIGPIFYTAKDEMN